MIGIVVPCFNEEFRISIKGWIQTINTLGNNCVWVFVDDGSKDRTFEILGELSGPNVKVLRLPTNCGKGEAVRAGLNFCISDDNFNVSQIGYLDADGAFALSDIIELTQFAETKIDLGSEFTTLIGSRVKLAGRSIQRNFVRHILGRIITTYVCFGWDKAPYDTQSGFKLFRNSSDFRQVIAKKFETKWFFDIEILVRLEAFSNSLVWEYPLLFWHDVASSNIRSKQFILISREIFKIRQIVKSIKHIGGA